MSRHRSFVSTIAAMQRAHARDALASERQRQQRMREAERTRRDMERARLLGEKERIRLFHEEQEREADARNESLAEIVGRIEGVLSESLGRVHRLDFEHLKKPMEVPKFDPGELATAEAAPRAEDYLPAPPGFFARLFPGASARHQEAVRQAQVLYHSELSSHGVREKSRQAALQSKLSEHNAKVAEMRAALSRQHREVDALKAGYEAAQPASVRQYFEAVLACEDYLEGWPEAVRIAFLPESKQLAAEYDFPGLEIVPEIAGHKYIRAKKEITTSRRADSERRRMYTSLIAQGTLRVIHVLFSADYAHQLESIVFNGHVNAVDQATGREVHPCLVTLRTTRDSFSQLDLARVDAESCLRGLSASVSRKPSELAAVKPILEFNMVDPRFIEEEDVISRLDNRTNLMLLSPHEFESLITNLFEKMGLETRQTRPSRDGGVDCVAYDPRPIFGGKVVIQAKRYKNTVGVSAVRDLFGTVQNEGASKGILVTTSGFGKASYEFANGKPLELLSGSNLLYLLSQHAGIEAKIEIPDDWKDPGADLGE